MSTEFRNCTIYVSHPVYWALKRLTKATNDELDKMSPSATVDQLADSMLLAAIEESHPKLLDLYKKMKDIEDEAEDYLTEKGKTTWEIGTH